MILGVQNVDRRNFRWLWNSIKNNNQGTGARIALEQIPILHHGKEIVIAQGTMQKHGNLEEQYLFVYRHPGQTACQEIWKRLL